MKKKFFVILLIAFIMMITLFTPLSLIIACIFKSLLLK